MLNTQDAKPFNVGYAMLEDYLDTNVYPASLTVHESTRLQDAVAASSLNLDTHMLAFEHDGRLFTFPLQVVLCYNVIQFEDARTSWILTFCNACNAGMVFDPQVKGTTLHFQRRGAYDGTLLIWDRETKSYWQHITGECLYGESAGKQLAQTSGTRHLRVSEALAQDPEARLFTTPLTSEQEKLSGAMEKMRSHPERVAGQIASTIERDDNRRPRFELGLGIWNSRKSCFIPLLNVAEKDNLLATEFDGRPLLIYHVTDALSPVAVYVDPAVESWNHESVRFADGSSIQNNTYHAADGTLKPLDTPIQFLMRWYGFASAFPECQIYGEN